jgi:BlaI family transcriptional regulator, penicillinase repressor
MAMCVGLLFETGTVILIHYELTASALAMPNLPLTRYELELMDVLWRIGDGTVQDVCNELKRPLAYTTVMTTLRLLHGKKKVLQRTKRGRAYVYQPLVSRDEVSRSVIRDLQDVLFADRLPTLMLGLLEDGKLSEDDVRALKAALEKVERQDTES